jgi:hypothetical protein
MAAVRVGLPNNKVILFEVDEGVGIILGPSPAIGAEEGEAAGEQVQKIANSLLEISEVIADTCSALVTNIRIAADRIKPEEWTLEFSVKLAGEAGLPMVSKISGEGSVKVSVKFKG